MNAPTELADMLPEEVQALLFEHEQQKLMRLEEFSMAVAKKRDEAVEAREASDWERIVAEDEEHYVGIDNANRGKTVALKPPGISGGLTSATQTSGTRSTVFLNITRPYVDAIVARTCDILLPTDDSNWALQPTPIPSLIKAMQSEPQMPQPMAAQMPPPPAPGQMPMPQGGMPGQPPAPPSVADQARAIWKQASDSAERAQKRIADWQAEYGHNAELRKVIHDSARIGVGLLKGPFPDKMTSIAFVDGNLVGSVEIKPRCKRVDPRNFYPDPSCGENIHDGEYVFEKDYLTAKRLRKLKGLPGYIDKMIDEVLEEGPQVRKSNDRRPNEGMGKTPFEVWHGYLQVEKEDLIACGMDEDLLDSMKSDAIGAIITIVNNKVIRAAVNPLDSGSFPYDVFPWQRVVGQWAGVGVSRQIRAPQQVVNGALRNQLDNAGLSGGPMLIVRQNVIRPADGSWELRPRKIFYATEDADMRGVNDAITAINIPSLQAELQNIITFALQSCEQITGFPLLMAGQNGQSTPDTYGGQMLATANASTVLRAVARNFDDFITVPCIKRFYEWLLTYSDDDTEKGDFQIVARGSSALVEKEVQAQEMTALIQLSANPAFGLDPAKIMEEYLKSRRFDVRKFQLSEEQKAQAAQQPPAPPPAVQAAQIRSEASVKVAEINAKRELDKQQQEYQLEVQAAQSGALSPQMASAQAQIAAAQIRAQAEIEKERYRSDSELAYAQMQARMAETNDLATMRELELKRQIAEAEFALKHQLTLEEAKVRLATTTMQEGTKRQIAAAKMQEGRQSKSHDADKTVANIIANERSAAEARAAEDERLDRQHAHEMELKKKELAALSKRVTEAPGKRQ